jgi:D-alanine-D-alanine ligase
MIRVGVLRGGADDRYKASLDNGASILACLREEDMSKKYTAIDIFIDESGVWHIGGIPHEVYEIKEKVDVVINALLGKYAENGNIQKMLEINEIPYTSSDSKSSSVCQNKYLTKEEFKKLGIKTPNSIHFQSLKESNTEDKGSYSLIKARTVWEKMSPPWIIKPVTNGASVGVVLCKTFNELTSAIQEIADIEDEILVEEFIQGKEATVGVINNFRDKEVYTLPPVEIRLSNGASILDIKQKSENLAKMVCPGSFTHEEKEEMERIAANLHRHFKLSFYSKIDFIVHPRKGVYVLEVNTQSEFMEKSQIPEALEAVGSNLKELIEHLIKEALVK